MRKRLRKKCRLGEFRQYGFEVEFKLPDALPDTAVDHFWDRFIFGFIESQKLSCGGGCGRTWSIFVTPEGRRSATEDDRQLIQSWLDRQSDVRDVRIGPLVDAWHSA
jgi:hypothetical protein